MPVDTLHADYTTAQESWTRCNDAVKGTDTIKAKESVYLPVPGGLKKEADRYQTYVKRAKWFNATSRTVEGLEGEVFRNDPGIDVPDALRDQVFNDFTLTGMSLYQAMRSTLRQRLITGRYGELIEYSEANSRPYSVGYTALNIINWRKTIDQVLIRVVLKENIPEVDVEDEFVINMVVQYRVLRLQEGVYAVQTYRKDAEGDFVPTGPPTIPHMRGTPLNFIPFQFYGVSENSCAIEKPPLLDLVDINFADYRNSADLEHGRHFCGLPFYYVMGAPELEDDNASVEVGSTAFWSSGNENAKAGVVEFSGSALGCLERARAENKSEMALLGARLLEEQKMVGETAEAIARRQASKQSVLQSMCEVQDQAHANVLRWMAQWMGLPEDEIVVSLNKDYTASKLAAQDLQALIMAWQSGAISKQSLFTNLQTGEIIPPDRTYDEETEMIEAEGPEFDMED